jgi:zinc finger protein
LNRLLVKADSASISIPSLEFEIPSGTQKGAINTVEGFIQSSIDGLLLDQTTRKVFNPDIAEKIDKFIEKLNNCLKIQIPFKMVVDDPSGNSFVENKLYPDTDPNLIIEKYTRSKDQEQQLGMFLNNDEDMAPNEAAPCDNSTGVSHDEVLTFSDSCPNCRMVTTTNMKLVDIPHFKEVVIMATSCDHCGYKHNEVKSGSGISEKGKRIELHLIDPSDLSRDILKSETATLSIPELQLDMTEGTLGGRFTTIEGLLSAIKKQLSDDNPFVVGDSSSHSLMSKFISDLTEVIKGKRLDIHIILDDPAGNSYLQNVYAPDDDPEMKIIQYERSFEQNENLGLNDMKTKDY